jgi:hypothetical protein
MVSMDKSNAKEYAARSSGFMTKKLDNLYFVAMTQYFKEYE